MLLALLFDNNRMTDHPYLETIIRQHIPLGHTPNARGFFPVLCRVCNDHGRKGKRAGFTFDDRNVGYNCFNCGHGATFDYNHDNTKLNRSMTEVLTAFGMTENDWLPALRGFDENEQTEHTRKTLSLAPNIVQLPDHFQRLTEHLSNEYTNQAIDYLHSRSIDFTAYPFYLADWLDKYKPTSEENKWYGRLIIPYFGESGIIAWQGRDLTDTKQRKYLNDDSGRSNIIINWNNMTLTPNQPLYVVEGFFDAYHINGVGVMSNKMSIEQIAILNKCAREKVVIPDKYGSGKQLAKQALKQGWSISTPDIGSCKDINEAIVKYGTLYVLNSIREHTYQGDMAEIMLEMYCKYEPRPTNSIRYRH